MKSKKILSDEEKRLRHNESAKRWRENNKEKAKVSCKKYYEKNKDELQNKMIEYGKKHYNDNKEQYKKNHQKYYEENKEIFVENGKQWRENNKEKLKEYHRGYEKTNQRREYKKRYNNIPEVKQSTRERNRKYDAKRRQDSIFRFNQNISRAINLSLKKNNLSKNGKHWEDLVGYTSQELRNHLENLFEPGMTWENREEWHIDHIIPKSFFEIKKVGDVEFRMCWRLENLQPLWAFDNISKKDRIILGDI